MPELPEVEVVRQGLQEILKDRPKISKIEITRPDLRFTIPIKQMQTILGEPVSSVERRAKYLLLRTAKGTLLSHLGMTGTWRIAPSGDELLHDHIYLHFQNSLRLAYRDPRRFGVFDFIGINDEPKQFKNLGPEPLEKLFTGKVLWQSLQSKKVSVKVAIMDQKTVVGVGNIYASEALYAAGIKPQTVASKISKDQCEFLVREIKKTLSRAIRQGGSSISDFASTNGSSGYFQNTFFVYGRDGESCHRCGQKIKSQILGGRNSFWCGRCQK